MPAQEVITAALATGAVLGVRDTASVAVKDAYAALKDLLKHRLRNHDHEVVRVLDADVAEPGVWQTRLGEALTESGADRDEQVIAAARRLLELADPAGSAAGKYQVDVRQAKGVQVGDDNIQHNTFS